MRAFRRLIVAAALSASTLALPSTPIAGAEGFRSCDNSEVDPNRTGSTPHGGSILHESHYYLCNNGTWNMI